MMVAISEKSPMSRGFQVTAHDFHNLILNFNVNLDASLSWSLSSGLRLVRACSRVTHAVRFSVRPDSSGQYTIDV